MCSHKHTHTHTHIRYRNGEVMKFISIGVSVNLFYGNFFVQKKNDYGGRRFFYRTEVI